MKPISTRAANCPIPRCLGLSAIVLLVGCAGVTVTPLNPDGTKNEKGVEGVEYYMPKPYLLVAELPPTPIKQTETKTEEEIQLEKAAGVAPAPTPTPTPAADPTKGNNTTTPAPASDTSFYEHTTQYAIKLIYLPDKTKPMAMSEHTGLFGSSEMKPALQDGWMLTSLDATADSKTSETLTALASLIGSVASATPAGAAAKAASPAKGTALNTESVNLSEALTGSHMLRPGLYEFVYNSDGTLKGLKHVAYFDPLTGVIPDVSN